MQISLDRDQWSLSRVCTVRLGASHRCQFFLTLCQLFEVLRSVRWGWRLATEQCEIAGGYLGRIAPRCRSHQRRLYVSIHEQVRHLRLDTATKTRSQRRQCYFLRPIDCNCRPVSRNGDSTNEVIHATAPFGLSV